MKKINIIKQDLLDLVQICNTKKEVANKLNISVDTLNTKLKQYDIIFDTRHWKAGKILTQSMEHPEINDTWLIDHWANTTKSIKQLAEEFNIPDSLIESRISTYKIKKTYKHTINIKKLFNVDDPHIWYIAGLATTDGYFPKKQDAVIFELVGDSEEQLLLDIKNYYDSSQEVKHYTHHNNAFQKTNQVTTVYFRMQAPGLQKFFSSTFGINLQNKTFFTGIPEAFPSEDCAKAFIRGCLDGDGYISDDCHTVTICTASSIFIDGFEQVIKKYTGISCCRNVAKRKDKVFPKITWRTNNAIALLSWVYSVQDCFKLSRKYNKFLENKQYLSKEK